MSTARIIGPGGTIVADQGADGAESWPVDTGLVQPLTDAELRDSPITVADDASGYFDFDDRTSDGSVETFTVPASSTLVWVRVDGNDGRANPGGGTPTETRGVFCEDGIAQPVTMATSSLAVWSPAGSIVRVWGYRR